MEPEEFARKYSWMVRPCSVYGDEYSDCTGITGRIHQYFVHGSTVDCTHWKQLENSCNKWTSENDIKALKEVIAGEVKIKRDRIENHKANDVWKKRDSPPESWNKPLPEWVQQREASSYLVARAREAKSGGPIIDENQTFCTIL